MISIEDDSERLSAQIEGQEETEKRSAFKVNYSFFSYPLECIRSVRFASSSCAKLWLLCLSFDWRLRLTSSRLPHCATQMRATAGKATQFASLAQTLNEIESDQLRSIEQFTFLWPFFAPRAAVINSLIVIEYHMIARTECTPRPPN